MAITSIVTGGAHSAYGNEKAGDQKQNGKPDYSGEVSMRTKTESQFKSSYAGYTLYRLINTAQAAEFADLMIRACNNPNVGYSQGSSRQDIFNYGVDSSTPINCDCSSLVCYCLSKSTGISFNTNTTGLKDALPNSGLFMSPIAATSVSFSTNPPCNGDILLKPGSHVEAVVSGNPRDGKESEITAGTWVGDGNALQAYSNSYGTTYTFSPRKTAPTADNVYYNQTYGETTNGSYAWGRFSEIMRSPCNLCRGIARKWYVYSEDGYKRGTAPLPGAVMCFTDVYDVNDPGIVAIVEEVNPNSIYVSWKHPRTGRFEYFGMVKDNGSWDMDIDKDGKKEFHCQGFIYNPAVDAKASVTSSSGSFVATAKAQIGDTGAFVQKYTDVIPKRDPWAAAFIVAVAKKTGNLLDIVIPNTYACSNIGRLGVTRDMGTWFDGPALGGNPTPKAGDIVLIRTTALHEYVDYKYGCDKAGIVIKVKARSTNVGKNQTTKRSIEVAMGDVQDQVKKVTYTTDSGQISGYFRPNWDKTDGYTREVKEQIEMDGLYTEGTSMDDAALRDLRYVDITLMGLEPSIKSSGMTLSAINYTGMLANFYTAFVESGTCPGYSPDLMMDLWNDSNEGYYDENGNFVMPADSNLYNTTVNMDLTTGNSTKVSVTVGGKTYSKEIYINGNARQIFEYLTSHLGSESAAIGIMGNMVQESGGTFNTGSVNGIGASGLCQWLGGRKSSMIQDCGSDWANNLTGQLNYIIKELNGADSTAAKAMPVLKSSADTIEGAKSACNAFLKYFERPGNLGTESAVREAYTEAVYKLIKGSKT